MRFFLNGGIESILVPPFSIHLDSNSLGGQKDVALDAADSFAPSHVAQYGTKFNEKSLFQL
jgi:hypothetical protein